MARGVRIEPAGPPPPIDPKVHTAVICKRCGWQFAAKRLLGGTAVFRQNCPECGSSETAWLPPPAEHIPPDRKTLDEIDLAHRVQKKVKEYYPEEVE